MRRWAALALMLASCRPADDGARLDQVRRSHARLRQAVDESLAGDAALGWAQAVPGDVVVAFRTPVLESWIESSLVAYLQRVDVDVPLGRTLREGREVEVNTFFGKVVAGRWDVEARIRRVAAQVSVREASVRVAEGTRFQVRLQVALEAARIPAHVSFSWDARRLAGAVCRDFRSELDVEARAVSARYPVTGEMSLGTAGDRILATPTIPEATRTFHLRLDLSPRSWQRVRAELDEQDKLLRCGIALDPEQILDKLRELGAKGVDLEVPASAFAALELPAGLQSSVTVEDQPLALDVETAALDSDAERTWYAARVAVARAAPARAE